MSSELLSKLAGIISEEMMKDGVFPKNPWRPNKKTRNWIEFHGFKMDYLAGTNNYFPQRTGSREPTMSWSTQKEGFSTVKINHSPGVMLIYVPDELAFKIALFGALPPLDLIKS